MPQEPLLVKQINRPLLKVSHVFCFCFILGSFCGKLSSFKASELGTFAIQEALKRASINPDEISEVIMGQVDFIVLSKIIYLLFGM